MLVGMRFFVRKISKGVMLNMIATVVEGQKQLTKTMEEAKMKESIYKSYDELPLFLNAEIVGKLLGISPSSSYELMHEDGFPTLRIGNRMVVPKEKFIHWVEENTIG